MGAAWLMSILVGCLVGRNSMEQAWWALAFV